MKNIWDKVFKNESTLNLWKTAFKKFKWGMVCFRFFKGRPPQILLGPFLNTLSHTNLTIVLSKNILHYQRQYCFVKWLEMTKIVLEKSKVWWTPTFCYSKTVYLWEKRNFGVNEHSFKKRGIQNCDRNIQNKGCENIMKKPICLTPLIILKAF